MSLRKIPSRNLGFLNKKEQFKEKGTGPYAHTHFQNINKKGLC